MTDPEIFCIYARAANGAIGKDGKLPWYIPEDLERFKALTMGLPIIMGRRTFQSLPGILPGRRHIVLTRRERWDQSNNKRGGKKEVEVARSIEEALVRAREGNEAGQVAIVGGAAIYDVFLPLSHRVELTEIHADFDGDTFMPPLGAEWQAIAREDHPADRDRPAYSFVTLEKAA